MPEFKPCNCGERDYCIGQASMLPGRVCKIAAFDTRPSDAVLEAARDVVNSFAYWMNTSDVSVITHRQSIEKLADELRRLLPPSAPVCGTCGGKKRVPKVYGTEYNCELSTTGPCPYCSAPKEEA